MINRELIEKRLKERLRSKFQYEVEGSTEKKTIRIDNFFIRDPEGKVTVIGRDGEFMDFHSLEECNNWLDGLKQIDSPQDTPKTPKKEESLPAKVIHNMPSNERPIPKQHAGSIEIQLGSGVLAEANNIVMENIRRLQAPNGAKFIPQAQQINTEVKTMIDLAKTELEIIKVIQSQKI